jgi:hypothetical protein
MNKKTGILLISILGTMVILASGFYLFYYSQKRIAEPTEQDNVLPSKTNETANNNTIIESGTRLPVGGQDQPAEKPVGQADLERMAKSFAERFGSFSNQSNFANIKDLKLFMSEKMKTWADAYIEKNKKNDPANQVYYGLTTKAVTAKARTYDNTKGEALIVVETRRREAIGVSNNSSRLYNQSIHVSFVKENGAWKVDSAFWQE